MVIFPLLSCIYEACPYLIIPLYLSLLGQLLLIAFSYGHSHIFFFFTCLVYPPFIACL